MRVDAIVLAYLIIISSSLNTGEVIHYVFD